MARDQVCIVILLNSLLLFAYINRDLNMSTNFSNISNICYENPIDAGRSVP